MTVYVAECGPLLRYLWADDHLEAVCMMYAIGSDESGYVKRSAWEFFYICEAEQLCAEEFGATVTDRFGVAEWMAKRRDLPEDRDFLARIAACRAERKVLAGELHASTSSQRIGMRPANA